MATFTKFDPNAFLESAGCGGGSAKGPQNDRTLATVPGTPAQIHAPRLALGVPSGRSGGWSDNCDGRTAFEGGAPQAWAEALARLDPAHPPRDVPRQRWVQFIDDCGRFLDSGWAQRAIWLGWAPIDLFGCDRERPYAKVDQAGLLWLIEGRSLIALSHDIAVIGSPSEGGQRHYRRRAGKRRQNVMAWELADEEGAMSTTGGWSNRNGTPHDAVASTQSSTVPRPTTGKRLHQGPKAAKVPSS